MGHGGMGRWVMGGWGRILCGKSSPLVLQGHVSTLGLMKNLDHLAGEDAVIVQVLKRRGAVPFVKTNVPQSMLK